MLQRLRFIRSCLCLCCLCLSWPAVAAPSFRWATALGGDSNLGGGVAVDSSGDVLISGGFFGKMSFGNTNLTSRGGDDIYLAKYDRNGGLVWLQQAGGSTAYAAGSSGDACYSVAMDSSGNSFITGYFAGTSTFGSSSNLTSSGGNDIYVAKYDPSGNLLWARRAGGPYHDTGLHLKVDGAGNCYVPGFYRGTATFGTTNITVIGGSPTYSDLYLAKYDPSGNVVWVKSAGGTLNDVSQDVAIDANTNVFLTGYFTGSATFDNTNVTAVGANDFFLGKYNSAGTLLWVQTAGSAGADYGRSVVTDGTNAYVSVIFSGLITFGTTTFTNRGGTDLAVLKYNSAGALQWAQQIGGPGDDKGSLALDALGNLYVTGGFVSSALLGTTNLTSLGGSDCFVAKYDAAGKLLWAKQAGGTNTDSANDITIDAGQNVYVTGNIIGNTAFDSFSLTNNNTNAVFLARLNPEPPLLAVNATGALLSLTWSTNWQAVLESAANLNTNTTWTPITNGLSITGGQNIATNAVNGAGQFYRLRIP